MRLSTASWRTATCQTVASRLSAISTYTAQRPRPGLCGSMQAITAVIIGGMALIGGVGRIWGSICGAFLLEAVGARPGSGSRSRSPAGPALAVAELGNHRTAARGRRGPAGQGDVTDGRSVFRVAFWSADWTPWAALDRFTAECAR